MNVGHKRDRIAAAMAAYRTRRPAAAAAGAAAGRPQPRGAPEPIAIIGVAGYFPQCMSAREFWTALDAGRRLLEEIPPSRFDWQDVYAESLQEGRSVTKWGGFIPDIRSFDPELFGILADEAKIMDPQQRLLTMAAYHAFEDAGYAPGAFAGSRTGVFVGVERNEYALRMAAAGADAGNGPAQADSMLANRISYVFDLDGPSEIVNTMCSSGAVALHRAVAALRGGEVECALVGAANVILCTDAFVKLSATGQMSPVPNVKSFGAAARGYLRSEGVCSVLLKPLARAEADGDPIYATILHTAINYNGRQGTSIAAPSASRHSALIQKCYREAGVSVRDLRYIEAQGMGNPVSDIAEWNAFNHALESLAAEQGQGLAAGQCHVSTLKPMAGHMHAASALGALLKIVHSLRTGTIYPILDFSEPNPALDLDGRPCALAIERRAWPEQDAPRVAGLHSHGSGGNNAHVLVQEYRRARPAAAAPGREVLPASGRSPELLKRQLRALVEDVERHPDWSLGSVAHTLQRGRDALPDRVAFVAESREAWLGQAKAFLDGGTPEGVFRGEAADGGAPAGAAGDAGGAPGALARAWARGAAVEWPEHRPSPRVNLPGLEFKTAEYWFDAPQAARPLRAAPRLAQGAPQAAAVGRSGRASGDRAAPAPGDGAARQTAEGVVQQVLEQMLHDRGGRVDLEARFDELGFDSLMVLRLCERVRAVTGLGLEPAVLFELGTPRAVVDHLTRAPAGGRVARGGPATGAAPPRAPLSTEREPIAIVGLAGSYPQARTLRELWSNLRAAKDCTGAPPPERRSSLATGGAAGEIRAGWLDGVHEFDPLFFHLSPAEARYMHPKERLFLQCAWHAVEDAGYTPRSLEREVVGVFVGVSKAGLDAYKDSYFSLANRVSFRMNFSGPSQPVDTACSASLSAVHEACLHLQAGECTVALAGGVNAYTHASTFEEFARLGVMSRDGKTRAFGAGASGFVPGEGVGCVVLKPLRRAVEDGDHVYGVILGTAINHGGRANGYTVPSPLAHKNLIRLAMARAGVHARDIGYVEAHGTGTPLGDPIEVRGLTEAFREDTDERGFCALGSVKSNIGHLEAAAGVAGLTKVLLQFAHRKILPSLHSARLNDHIDFERTPFVVPQRVTDWPAPEFEGQTTPRLASVSSFGAGGSNAHVVVQEYAMPPAGRPDAAADAPSESLFVLSAQSEAALRRYAGVMGEFLESAETVDLADLTFTLQVGREAMEWRLAIVADGRESLLRALRSFVASGRAPGLLSGRAGRARSKFAAFGEDPGARELLRSWLRQGKLRYLAELWVAGEELDWDELYTGQRRRRVSLPGYPFEREQVPAAEAGPSPAEATASPTPASAAPAGARPAAAVTRTLLLAPAWRRQSVAAVDHGERGEPLVILCGDGLPRPRTPHVWIELPRAGAGERYGAAVVGAFREIKRFLTDKPRAPRRLQLVVPASGEEAWLSGLAGLTRTARRENEHCRAQLIGVEPDGSPDALDALLAREAAGVAAEQVRYEGGERYVLEWDEYGPAASPGLPVRDGGVYLITGGAGGLGRIFAGEILGRAPHATVILVGRSPLDGERARAVEALRGAGRGASYRQVDVADEAAVARLVSSIRSEFGGLNGVLHCAGVIRDAHIVRKAEADIADVLAPKVAGTIHLDRASADCDLEFFVMFSSAAGAFGHAGQADYAAGSAFQDAYARHREGLRRAGRRAGRTLSVDWGLWQDGGMTVGKEYQELMRASSGVVALPTRAGVASLASGLASGLEQLAVLEVDPAHWSAGRAAVRPAPRDGAPAAPGPSAASVLSAVTRVAAEQLAMNASDVDVDVAYEECGLDLASLHGMREKLASHHGLELDPELLREASTLRTLAERLWAKLEPAARHGGAPAADPGRGGERGAANPSQGQASRASATSRERLAEHVKRCAGAVLELAPERLQLDTPFERYGIDSLKTLQITAELEKSFGPLSKTLFFEHQTLQELIEYLLDAHGDALDAWSAADAAGAPRAHVGGATLAPHADAPPAPARGVGAERDAGADAPGAPARAAPRGRAEGIPVEPARAGGGETRAGAGALDIAVIGLAGRYPQAPNLDELWRVLREGRDCVTTVPRSRWDHDRYYDADRDKPGKTYARWGGFLESVDAFDAAFFNISPREAQTMEPQERLFLEVAHEAIESAGYSRQALAKQSVLNGQRGAVGVFAGVTYEEYQLYGAEETAKGRPMVLSMSPASIANRVSYFCNFHGPSMSVDAMCASSLTTLHLACQSLRNGECRVALAGGVNVSIHPAKYLMLGYGGFASARGRCHSFGADADGFVPSEGVGVVVLKPLAAALADGDRIYGVIKASAINHGGKTNGYSVPNPKAQTAVVSQALRQSGVEPRAISYLEAHGTGTLLGDPIEIAALNQAFRAYTDDRHFCAIGAVKSNLGHCESAAGVAGLTKVLLQMKHATLVPSLHAGELNPNVAFEHSPFVVQRELAPWPRPVVGGKTHPRIAGVSSFGAGGSNAHVIVEEWAAPPAHNVAAGRVPLLFVLSAKSVERLREYARRLLTFVQREVAGEAELVDLMYTLQAGREPLPERLAAAVRDRADLEQRLAAFVAGAVAPGVLRGRAPEAGAAASDGGEDEISTRTHHWHRAGAYEALLEHWARGGEVDWDVLYRDGRRPSRMAAPTYPFDVSRYWLPKPLRERATPPAVEPQVAASRHDAGAAGEPPPLGRVARHTPPVEPRGVAPRDDAAAAPRGVLAPSDDAAAVPPAGKVKLLPLTSIQPARDEGAVAPAPAPTALGAAAGDARPRDAGRAGGQDAPKEPARAEGEVAALVEWLRSSLAETLYMNVGEVKPNRDFMDLGLDSIIGVEWIRAINRHFGTTLAANAVYEYRTVATFAAMLASVLPGPAPAAEAAPPAGERGAAAALGRSGAVPDDAPAGGEAEGVRERRPADEASGRQDRVRAEGEVAALVEWLRSSLAETLYMNVGEVKPNRDFMDLGLDSIIGVEWIRAINRHFGTTLAANAVYEYRTVATFAAMLASVLPGPAPAAEAAPPAGERRTPPSLDELLISVQNGALDVARAEELLDELV